MRGKKKDPGGEYEWVSVWYLSNQDIYITTSTCTSVDNIHANFGFFRYDDAYGFGCIPMYTSDGTETGRSCKIRAVVELSPNITIGEKDNTLGWSYTI